MFEGGRPDESAWEGMPVRLKHEVMAYYKTLDPYNDDDFGLPCFWLMPEGTCRHYEHRPEVCREFEVGGEDCLRIREHGVSLG
jgi:Fe-S-cluster containining protein